MPKWWEKKFKKKCEVENIIDLYMIYVISIVKSLINIYSRFTIFGERGENQ